MSDSTAPPKYDWNDRIPVVVRRDRKDGTYCVSLAGIDLEQHLAADGVHISFESDGVSHQPVIHLTFAPGATELDLDAELIGYLQEKAKQDRRPVIVNHSAGCKDVSLCGGC